MIKKRYASYKGAFVYKGYTHIVVLDDFIEKIRDSLENAFLNPKF